MILDKGIDDGFEGSINEHHIFKEVFSGSEQGNTSTKCRVTGAIKFESVNKSNSTDLLVSRSSEISAVSSQFSANKVNALKDNSGSGFSANEHALSTKDDNVANDKRIKLSLDEEPDFTFVKCCTVESASQGIVSSSYLLKGEIPRRSLPNFNENEEKGISAFKTIPSPVSQESSVNKSVSLRTHAKRTMKSKVDNLLGDKTLSHKDTMKDPKPLLRKYIQDLLQAVGWQIRLRTKNNVNKGYVYTPPQSRGPIWQFHKVWSICGQSLSIDRSLLVPEDGKQWNDMASFWSDLFVTLRKVDEEPLLSQKWCFLDPLVNLVFIEKKLGLLKAGEAVEVKFSSLVIDPHANEGTVTPSKKRSRGKQSHEISPYVLPDASLLGGSVLTNTELNNYGSNDSYGTRITVDFGQLNGGRVKALNGVPVSLSGEKCTTSRTRDGLNLNALQANGLDGQSDHSSSCLYDAPFIPINGLAVFAESVSPPQDGSINSLVTCRYISNQNERMASEIDIATQIGSGRGVPGSVLDSGFLEDDINLRSPRAQNGDVQKRSGTCQNKDEGLLISATIKKKNPGSSDKTAIRKTKAYKPKPLRKRKTQKGSCRLLPRILGKGGKHNEKKWFTNGSRTVLSWLINCGSISLKEVIQYRNSKDNTVVKEGLIMKDGVLCICCNSVISLSKFKSHAGFGLNDPSLNLVMGTGKLFTLCQLEAWSDEYKTRKSATRPVDVEDLDQNDDSCGLCGDGGELICCDNCPSTFHQKCLYEQELPEGDWYCQHCICRICGELVVDKEAAVSVGAFKCSQCDNKYHGGCLEEKVKYQDAASGTWFCGESCQEVYLGLQFHVGSLNCLSDGYTWTLLKCIHGNPKDHSTQMFVALKAECNSKLAVALTILEECFLSMVDARTGIDMIPHVLYNWGSEFARLNYNGFYTMVLEKDDVLISAASIRIHGVTVAEMPLIATCSKYRRQGMCRRLMNSIEEMLKSFKVEKLVITAIPGVVETWTVGFGFEPLEEDERKSLSHVNLMVFPGTVWLKKTLYKKQATAEQTSSGHVAPFYNDGDHADKNLGSDTPLTVDSAKPSNGSVPLEGFVNETDNGRRDGDMEMTRDGAFDEDCSNMS